MDFNKNLLDGFQDIGWIDYINQLLIQNYSCKLPCTRAELTVLGVMDFTEIEVECQEYYESKQKQKYDFKPPRKKGAKKETCYYYPLNDSDFYRREKE